MRLFSEKQILMQTLKNVIYMFGQKIYEEQYGDSYITSKGYQRTYRKNIDKHILFYLKNRYQRANLRQKNS